MTDTWYDKLGVFDLETTGIDVETSRIVSAYVGVIDADGTAHPGGKAWLADPGVEIPAGASAVHGISTERARAQGAPADEVVAEIIAVLRALLAQGVPVVIYNAPYDLTLLNREAVRYGIEPLSSPAPIIDPFVLDKEMDKYRRGKRTLEVTAGVYGVDLLGAHDATADAVAAGRLTQAIGRKHGEKLGDFAELHAKQQQWCAQQAASFQEFKRRTDPGFVASGSWPER